jgi:hypothetical protein
MSRLCRIGLALGGGGAKGLAHLGVPCALALLVGTSTLVLSILLEFIWAPLGFERKGKG